MTVIREKALTSRTIRKAFANRGIYPLDASEMAKVLKAQLPLDPGFELRIIDDESPPDSSSIASGPPTTIPEIKRITSKG
jgi:hypothetical protein